jgi:predicted permease
MVTERVVHLRVGRAYWLAAGLAMKDIRYALRAIAARPWLSAAIVVTLGLGIGVNTTVFTLSNAVLYKPLPYPHGSRIVAVVSTRPAQNQLRMDLSYPDFLDLRAGTTSFDRLEATSDRRGVLSDADVPAQQVAFGRVTAGLLALTSVPPVLGRLFTAEDERPEAPLATVIGEDLWRTRYHGSKDVIGRVVRLDEAAATIVGVMPKGFAFPNNEAMWVPLRPEKGDRNQRDNRYLLVIGMLKPGQSTVTASRDVTAAAERLAAAYPETNRDIRGRVITFNDRFSGGKAGTVFELMLAAVGLVLLVACANVANMMLGAALERRREMAVRTALGASPRRLVRQLLVESVLLSVIGGLIGLGLTALGVHAFDLAVTTENMGKPAWILFEIDYRVLLYLAAICLGTGILFGLAPALRSARVDLNETLKEGGRGGSGRSHWLSSTLVVLQFTLAVVLLAASGLMMRSLVAGQRINPSVPSTHVLTARVSLPNSRYADKAARLRFYEDVLPRIAAMPGVTQAALLSDPPGVGAGQSRFELDGHLIDKPDDRPYAANVVVSDGYFPMMNVPIVRGRSFDAGDGQPGHEAAIVSRAFAAAYWPNEDPIGQRLRFNSEQKPDPWMTVVGVSGDIVQRTESADPTPIIFTPFRQSEGYAQVALRASGDAGALANPLRKVMQSVDREVVLSNVEPLDTQLSDRLWPYRVFGTLFLVFAATALLMAAVGLYAVMSQATMRRTREIGIRMALGATPGRVLGTVMRRGIFQLAVGLVLGLGAAFWATGAMRTLLVGVEPSDPVTFILTASVLLGVGLFACWLPARRAAALPPVRALSRTGES